MKTKKLELAGVITISLLITYLSLEAFFTAELTDRTCKCLNTAWGAPPCCATLCHEDCESPHFNVCKCK